MKKRYKWAIGTSVSTVAILGISLGTVFGLAASNSSSTNLNSSQLTKYLNQPQVKSNLNAQINSNVNLMVPKINTVIPTSYLSFPNLSKLSANAGVNEASITKVVVDNVDTNVLNNSISINTTLTIKNGIGEATILNVLVSGFKSNIDITNQISSVSRAFQNNSFSVLNTTSKSMDLTTFEQNYQAATNKQEFLYSNIKFNNQEIKTLIPNFSINNFNISVTFPANSFPLLSLSYSNYPNSSNSSIGSSLNTSSNNTVLSNIQLIGLVISPAKYQQQQSTIENLNVAVKPVQLIPLATNSNFTSVNFNNLLNFVNISLKSTSSTSAVTAANLNAYLAKNLSSWEFSNINFLQGTVTLIINLNQSVSQSFNLTGFAPAQSNTKFQNISQAYQQAQQVLESLSASDVTADMYNLNVKNGINALNKPSGSTQSNFWAANSSLSIQNASFQVNSKEGLNLNINVSLNGNFELSNVPIVKTATGQLNIPEQNINAQIIPLLIWNEKSSGQSGYTTYTYPSFQTFYASQNLKVTNGIIGTQYSAGGNIILNSLASSNLPPLGAKISVGYIILQSGGVPNLSSSQVVHTIINMESNANQNIGYLTFLENMMGGNQTVNINNTNSQFNVAGVSANEMTNTQRYATNSISFDNPNISSTNLNIGSQSLSNLDFSVSSTNTNVVPTTPSTSTLSITLPSITTIQQNIESFWENNSSLSNIYLINNLINTLSNNDSFALKEQFLNAAFNSTSSYINEQLTTISVISSSNSNLNITLNLNPQYSYNGENKISFNLNVSNSNSPYQNTSSLETELNTYLTSLSQVSTSQLNDYFTSIFKQYYGANSAPLPMGNGGYSPFVFPIRSLTLSQDFNVSVNSIKYTNGVLNASVNITGTISNSGYSYVLNSQNLNVTFNPILIAKTSANLGQTPNVYGIINNTFGQINLSDLYSYSEIGANSFNNVNSVSLSKNPIEIIKNTVLAKGFYLSVTDPSSTNSLIGAWNSNGNTTNYYFSLPLLSMQYFAFQFNSSKGIESSGYNLPVSTN